jgi:DeoR/GlpR family transcriptional regulator of sugar metabolism
MHIQKAFVFPTAISLDYGICGYDDNILQLQDKLIESAKTVYMLADSEKFEKTAFRKLCDNDERFNYITDDKINLEIKKEYEENNIKIFVGGKL